jgi:hypothetical protein
MIRRKDPEHNFCFLIIIIRSNPLVPPSRLGAALAKTEAWLLRTRRERVNIRSVLLGDSTTTQSPPILFLFLTSIRLHWWLEHQVFAF